MSSSAPTLVRHINTDVVRRLRTKHLHRQLESLRADRDEARREILRLHAVIDELLDLSAMFSLTPQLEKIATQWVRQVSRASSPGDTHLCSGDMTSHQAQQALQDHLYCLTEHCPTRQAAIRTLWAAKKLIPDSHRPTYTNSCLTP